MELVETHNLALALKRLRNGGNGYDEGRWRRAMMHAVMMEFGHASTITSKIRQALEIV